MDITTPLSHLTPAQRWALYDAARREAAELRRTAMRELASQTAAAVKALWQRVAHPHTARPASEVPACPR